MTRKKCEKCGRMKSDKVEYGCVCPSVFDKVFSSMGIAHPRVESIMG